MLQACGLGCGLDAEGVDQDPAALELLPQRLTAPPGSGMSEHQLACSEQVLVLETGVRELAQDRGLEVGERSRQ